MNNLTYKYYKKQDQNTAFLVLHGGGAEGIESPFISAIFSAIADSKESVLAINMPYCERGEENSSGPELKEETEALDFAIEFLRKEGYEKIVIIAKSLGGIIASYWFADNNVDSIDLAILGYVAGSVNTKSIDGRVKLVIQGENDRFAGEQKLKEEFRGLIHKPEVIIVKNADHSYRDDNKQPTHQVRAIDELAKWIKINY